jgi:hypothetical protein
MVQFARAALSSLRSRLMVILYLPMKRGSLFVFTIFLLSAGFSVPLVAEDADVPAASMEAFTARYLEANSGLDKLNKVGSLRIEAVRTMAGGERGEFIYQNRFPNLERSVWSGPNHFVLRRGENGKCVWAYTRASDGRTTLDLAAKPQMRLFDWTVIDPAHCGAALKFLPRELLNGVDCYRIRAVFQDGSSRDYWFEVKTLRPAKVLETASDGSVRYFVIDKSNKYDGIWFPQVMREVNASGADLERVEVSDVQLRLAILPDFAEPPSNLPVSGGK